MCPHTTIYICYHTARGERFLQEPSNQITIVQKRLWLQGQFVYGLWGRVQQGWGGFGGQVVKGRALLFTRLLDKELGVQQGRERGGGGQGQVVKGGRFYLFLFFIVYWCMCYEPDDTTRAG
jgi:hypothetical protein